MKIDPKQIPNSIREIANKLTSAGFEAYLVGGCTRDLLLGRKPKDWDLTTNAKPDEIMALWGGAEAELAFYENDFGTVTIKNEPPENPRRSTSGAPDVERLGWDQSLRNVEITPYRTEGTYSDFRRPDEVKFSDKLEDDLKRRDFTINAIAYNIFDNKIVDNFNGIKDIKDKVIRAVGNPDQRFKEDALRMLRAIRLSSELGFVISQETSASIASDASLLSKISAERIQVEFVKTIMSPEPMIGINMAQKLGLLKQFIPELEEGIGCKQNGSHIYDVWEHSLRALQNTSDKGHPLEIRLGALFHDVGKPRTREWSAERNDYTFYAHDVVGAKIAREIMSRLKFSAELTKLVSKFVRYHLFFSDTEQITLSAVRRIITKIGPEHIWQLMDVRVADRIGMGRPKERPYRLRKYESMVEEALRDPISVAMLKINGKRLIEITMEKPGPKLGWCLHALLEEVLEDPKLNTEEYLEKRALELMQLTEAKLRELGEAGKEKKEEADTEEIKKLRKKHFVE